MSDDGGPRTPSGPGPEVDDELLSADDPSPEFEAAALARDFKNYMLVKLSSHEHVINKPGQQVPSPMTRDFDPLLEIQVGETSEEDTSDESSFDSEEDGPRLPSSALPPPPPQPKESARVAPLRTVRLHRRECCGLRIWAWTWMSQWSPSSTPDDDDDDDDDDDVIAGRRSRVIHSVASFLRASPSPEDVAFKNSELLADIRNTIRLQVRVCSSTVCVAASCVLHREATIYSFVFRPCWLSVLQAANSCRLDRVAYALPTGRPICSIFYGSQPIGSHAQRFAG